MIKEKNRLVILTILLTTLLSIGIGSFATFSARSADLQKIDQQLSDVVKSVKENPNQPLSAALLIVDEQHLDFTLSLITQAGDETMVNPSRLGPVVTPSFDVLKSATFEPVSVGGIDSFRARTVLIAGGDFLFIANSLKDLDYNYRGNIRASALFTLIADAIAILITLLYSRRQNRRIDKDSLARMQEFLGDASHELRTPLTVIKGYTEMLSKGQLEKEEDKSRALSRVTLEIGRMETLIHDLLLLAELGERTEFEKEKVDLSELVNSHLFDFIVLNPLRTIDLNIEPDLGIEGSNDHLRRLIQNALNNISRHTPAGAPVTVRLLRNGKSILLTIEDGGPGLPDNAYSAKIQSMARFDKSRSRDSGGSGLGLSIMSAVVNEHKGSMRLRKSSLGGLALDIELPQ